MAPACFNTCAGVPRPHTYAFAETSASYDLMPTNLSHITPLEPVLANTPHRSHTQTSVLLDYSTPPHVSVPPLHIIFLLCSQPVYQDPALTSPPLWSLSLLLLGLWIIPCCVPTARCPHLHARARLVSVCDSSSDLGAVNTPCASEKRQCLLHVYFADTQSIQVFGAHINNV